ncbi:hypothetical protein ABID41_000783 [Phenylobacterium koreense]|uniref:Uncharacterized protein n=1 Tax=Phenylobacterium koreense TaxID=266125 RepID=A0ABV2EF78_9CAUL
MSLVRIVGVERLFDRVFPVVLIALSLGLAAATVSVGG